MKKKHLSLVLAAAMAVTLLSGCGGSDDPTAGMSEEEKIGRAHV